MSGCDVIIVSITANDEITHQIKTLVASNQNTSMIIIIIVDAMYWYHACDFG